MFHGLISDSKTLLEIFIFTLKSALRLTIFDAGLQNTIDKQNKYYPTSITEQNPISTRTEHRSTTRGWSFSVDDILVTGGAYE